MNISASLQAQLLTTKFFVPIAPGKLIPRPRLKALLVKSLMHPFTLVSAPAGFGKTILLADWAQALPANNPLMAWISLDEEDNEPRLFWTYVLTALKRQQPQRFSSLLTQLQSSQVPLLKDLLTELINLLVESPDHYLLILDDYQVITEQEVHSTLSYLIEHLPPQLHIILSSRADPPLPLAKLRAHGPILEVRTNELRCTAEETGTLFQEVMGIQLPAKTIEQVTARTEGWLVGLQLLMLSLPEQADPLSLLWQVSGDQRYILDYLTEAVLGRQPQEVQAFLLSTCILERLTASLCDSVMQWTASHQMLQWLEQANLFVVHLDSKRQWYRYHALFAEALRYRLERTQAALKPSLHARASRWYAHYNQTAEAILHAFHAKEWQWATGLIEQKQLELFSQTWGASERALGQFREWLEQLPAEVVGSRPHLCLACTRLLWTVTPFPQLYLWLDMAEATLTASLTKPASEEVSQPSISMQAWQEQENLLGEVIAWRALLWSFEEDGQRALALCDQALSLLSADSIMDRAQVAYTRLMTYYTSSANDAVTAIESGLQGLSLVLQAGLPAFALGVIGGIALNMIGTGQLHEIQRLVQQATQLRKKPEGQVLSDVGWPTIFQAEILREWNQLSVARSLIEEAISLCQQIESTQSLVYLVLGYTVLLHICLSCGDYDAARSALEEVERVGMKMNRPAYSYHCHFSTIDQVRLWIICGERSRASRWLEELDLSKRYGIPLVREREEVACARVLLAKQQSDQAVQRLEPVFQRATAGQRWGHVIEIRLLQALAYQMSHEVSQALDALSEAVRLGEPEGYLRSFLDEGAPMETLLYRLRKRDRKHGPTPYLDRLLAAFQQESMTQVQTGVPDKTKAQPLPEPLSERELQVLRLLARGTSNQEIAQELVIAYNTVKRHVSHIFSKLGVQNRLHAVKQARALGLLDEEC